jgi:hypothetical protein
MVWKVQQALNKGGLKVKTLKDVCKVLIELPTLFEITVEEDGSTAYIKNIYGTKEKD